MRNPNIRNKIEKMDFGPVFFVAPHPNRAIGSEKQIENYHIICSHKMDIIDYLKDEGIPVLCLDDESIKNTGKLLEKEEVLRYIKTESNGETPNIITFKPSPKIEMICGSHDFNYIGNNWKLNRRFENKINFVEITEKLKIPNAGSKVLRLENFEVAKTYLQKGKKCVIQLPRGFSGNSTFLIGNKDDFDKVLGKFEGRSVKIAEYLSGETFTINACIAREGVLVGKPIFQITGLTDFNGNKLGTSGNDYAYPEKLDAGAREKIFHYTKTIGEYMKKEGYKGIFGLDFIVGGNDRIDVIEINPRLIGSIPVYTKLQIENGEFPFLLIHIEEFLKEKVSLGDFAEQTFDSWQKEDKFRASQLILRNVSKSPLRIEKALNSGVYRIENGKLEFVKKSYYMGKALQPDEILLQCAPQGSVINPDIEYANIQTSYGIMAEEKLSDLFSDITDLVLNEIKFKNEI